MRKTFVIAVASCALLAITPATALAKHSRRHHRAHHARVHHKKFGTDPASPSTPSGTTTPVNTAPATMSVASFMNGVLTITDSTGQNIAGTVTADTRLICVTQQQPPNTSTGSTSTGSSGSSQGDDDGGSGGGDQGGGDQVGGDQGGSGDDQGGGDDQGEDQNQTCTTADLATGTPVQFAELSLSSTGTQWDTVVLQVAPSTVPTVPDTDNDGS